jgi:hypothetical protein
VLGNRLKDGSIYKLLAEHGHEMFRDDDFADCYSNSREGRPTVPARILATVMVLQAVEGPSDREATGRLGFDLRWEAAAGVSVGADAFHPTVFVGARNRLRASERPRRLFSDTTVVATKVGALGQRVRVLDSTPIYARLAADTVIQLRASLRKLLVALDQDDRLLARKVRVALLRDDDYATPGKPPCDWDDRSAREVLVDTLVTDCIGALEVLCDHELTGPSQVVAELVGLVAGQDVTEDGDGIFRSVQGVAKDRLISRVDTKASHGNQPVILGDCAYADGTTRTALSGKDFTLMAKCPPIRSVTGGFTKERFAIDLEQRTVTCPAGQVVIITSRPDGGGIVRFGSHCASCSLRSACTRSRAGRSVAINQHEAITQIARTEQRDPAWLATYRTN